MRLLRPKRTHFSASPAVPAVSSSPTLCLVADSDPLLGELPNVAATLVRKYFQARHYTTTDVGATESYDIHAVHADHEVKNEVKGATPGGSEIVLTYRSKLLSADESNSALLQGHKRTRPLTAEPLQKRPE